MFFTDDQCYDGILVSMLPIKAGEDLGSVEHDAVEFVDVEDLIGDLVATDACSGVGHPVKTVTAMATERDRRRSPDDLSS